VTCTLAVAVDEIDSNSTCAEDGKTHEQSKAGMHAHVDTFMNPDTLLCIGYKDGSEEEKDGQQGLHFGDF